MKEAAMECFNRSKDADKIEPETFVWEGPFAWPGYEEKTGLNPIPDVSGVYLWTFEYKKNKDKGEYLLYSAGVTTRKIKVRLEEHSSEFDAGLKTILDSDCASNGERVEIWHGYPPKKEKEECTNRFKLDSTNLEALEKQRQSMRIFILSEPDSRIQHRMEATLMHGLYYSKEPWSELADRGMNLIHVRYNDECPVLAINR